MNDEEIVKLIQDNIGFFRDKWKAFCDMVEDYGTQIEEYYKNPACKYKRDVEYDKKDNELLQKHRKIKAELKLLCVKIEKQKKEEKYLKSDEKKKDEQKKARLIKQFRKVKNEIASLSPVEEPPDSDYILCDYRDFAYLNIPASEPIWIKKDLINPLSWFLSDVPSEMSVDESCIYNCALLSIIHDEGCRLVSTDKWVYRHEKKYEGYFNRDKFCENTCYKLKQDQYRIVHALDNMEAKLSIPKEIIELYQIAKNLYDYVQWSEEDFLNPDISSFECKNNICLRAEVKDRFKHVKRKLKGERYNRYHETINEMMEYHEQLLSYLNTLEPAAMMKTKTKLIIEDVFHTLIEKVFPLQDIAEDLAETLIEDSKSSGSTTVEEPKEQLSVQVTNILESTTNIHTHQDNNGIEQKLDDIQADQSRQADLIADALKDKKVTDTGQGQKPKESTESLAAGARPVGKSVKKWKTPRGYISSQTIIISTIKELKEELKMPIQQGDDMHKIKRSTLEY